MTAQDNDMSDLQAAILFQSKSFLLRLQAGAPDEILTSILFQIRRNETELMKREHLMLHPRVWNILFTRYVNRDAKEIIDTLN